MKLSEMNAVLEKIEPETLASALPKEIERVAKLHQLYVGTPNGIFAATLMQAELDYAQRTIAEGDIVGMVQALRKLKEWRG